MKKFIVVSIGLIALVSSQLHGYTPFVILTASYNNKAWYERNLASIFEQKYDNWHLIYINDCSTDGTGELVQAYVAAHGMADKVTLVHNTERRGHMYNHYHAIHGVPADAVIVIVDGDDWLAHNQVLGFLDALYRTHNVWLTYGQFWYWTRNRLGICRKFPDDVLANNSFRDYPTWISSHLRTFYAGLFQRIKLEDLMYKGVFIPMSADAAAMYPMLEMAGSKHIRFIPEVLYIYNDANQLSFFHDRREEQEAIRNYLVSRPKYTKLNTLGTHTKR